MEIRSGELVVRVDPRRGCEIAQVTDRRLGLDLLLEFNAGGAQVYGSTWDQWIAAYRGGWQLLVPNAGEACTVDGREWGFHGEASTRSWTVTRHSRSVLQAEVSLDSAPLLIARTVRVVGNRVELADRVGVLGDTEVEFIWGHHPAFGGALLEGPPGSVRLVSNAGATQVEGDWKPPDLGAIPLRDGGTAQLYLYDFPPHAVAGVRNDTLGLQAELHWHADDFGCAWVWHEFGGELRPPFLGRVRTCAVEPMTTYPSMGAAAARAARRSMARVRPGGAQSRGVRLVVRHDRVGIGQSDIAT